MFRMTLFHKAEKFLERLDKKAEQMIPANEKNAEQVISTNEINDIVKEISINTSKLSIWLKEKSAASLDFLDEMTETYFSDSDQTDKILSSQTYANQMQEIMGKYEISEEEKKINRIFKVANMNLVIVAGSIFFPSIVIFTIPMTFYLAVPVFEKAYIATFQKKQVSSYTLDTLLLFGILLGGYFRLASIAGWAQILGMKLLIQSENNSKKSLMNLFGEQPRFVWKIIDGREIEIPIEELRVDDVIVINAGQVIPIDGTVLSGAACVDQHKLTGESQPVEKSIGSLVFATTLVLTGRIHVKTEKDGLQTTAMQIGQMLIETSDFKNSVESQGEVIADRLVLPTLFLSGITSYFANYSSGLAVLTNTFGFKMRILGPSSMLSFIKISSQQGILVKDGRSLELLTQIDTIIFDKTGTLTVEEPSIEKIHTVSEVDENEILRYAAAAEVGQTHPIARAIIKAADQLCLELPSIEDGNYKIGYGVEIKIADKIVHVGSSYFMEMEKIEIAGWIQNKQEKILKQGNSLVMVAFNNKLVGVIELRPTIRPEVKETIDALEKRGMSTVIISGDHEEPTRQLANSLNIKSYFANVLPDGKAKIISELQEKGHSVCFIGDGVNDSIALKIANVSISLKGATTAATDTAQVIFMDGNLKQLDKLFDIAKDFEFNMKSNLAISTVPSLLCIGGIIFLHWGIVTGIIITQGTLFLGIGNTLLPQLKYKENELLEHKSDKP